MTILSDYLTRVAELTELTLEELLPAETDFPPSIHSLMRYSTFARRIMRTKVNTKYSEKHIP